MELFLFWFGVAVVTGIVGSSKGRSGVGWFILGAVFSLLALILVALLPSLRGDPLAPSPDTHVDAPTVVNWSTRMQRSANTAG